MSSYKIISRVRGLRKFIATSVLCLSGVASANDVSETLVGEMSGEFAVNNLGAASYTVPLVLSPGTAGMEPKLAIGYSSQSAKGVLGKGFSLQGLSFITRTSASLDQDGFIDGVDFDEHDRFLLDGQRLMVVNSVRYGLNGSEYRTEIDSFSRIVAYGQRGEAPESFRVWTKSGLIYEYGHTSDSRFLAEGRTDGAVMRWAVNRITDTVGNYINFIYEEDPNLPYEQLLTRIEYTGNGDVGLLPYNAVEFVYEERPDKSMSYTAGSLAKSTQRLSKVIMQHDGEYAWDYRFTYDLNDTGESILKEFQRFFSEGSDEVKLAKTRFNYVGESKVGNMAYYNGESFIPSGTLDSVYRGTAYGYLDSDRTEGAKVLTSASRFFSGDFNGDGFADLVSLYPNNDSSYSWLGLSNGDGTFTYLNGTEFLPDGSVDHVYRKGFLSDCTYFIPADFNGDGLTDIAGLAPDNDSSYSWIGISDGDGTFTYTSGDSFLPDGSDGNLFRNVHYYSKSVEVVDYVTWQIESLGNGHDFRIPTEHSHYNTISYPDLCTRFMAGDFNGDSRTDLVGIYPDNDADHAWIALSDGDGTFTPINGVDFIPHGGIDNVYRDRNMNIVIGDFNGDGLNDLANVHPNNASKYSWIGLSKGDGSFEYASGSSFLPEGSKGNVYRDENSNIVTGDFNGDGATDIANVQGHNDSGYSWIALSKGDGSFEFSNGVDFLPTGASGNVFRNTDSNIMTLDYNGDGLSDLMNIHPDNDSNLSWLGLSNGDGTFSFVSGKDLLPTGASGMVYRSKESSFIAGDYNGDGMIDIASLTANNNNASSWLALNGNSYCFMDQVAQGYLNNKAHGVVTTFKYAPITDNLLYVKGDDAEYPIRNIQLPLYVVSSLEKDSGVDRRYATHYTYRNAKTHLRGRGFLGFEQFESFDFQTHLSTVESVALDFPFTGLVLTNESYYIPNPKADPESDGYKTCTRRVVNQTLFELVSGGTLFPYIAKSEEFKWTLQEPVTPYLYTTTYNWFDGQNHEVLPPTEQPKSLDNSLIVSGNLTKNQIDYGGGMRVSTVNTYNDLASNTDWFLGRLERTVVTHTAPETEPVVRTSSFEYYTADTGLLRSEIIEPENDALKVRSYYFYDEFGNTKRKKTLGENFVGRNILNVKYDARGRFIVASRNALEHETRFLNDPIYGAVLSSTDPNGLTTSWEYDLLGRAVSETRADGTVTSTTYAWDHGTLFSVSDPHGRKGTSNQFAAFRMTSLASGSVPVTTWYDIQGREIRIKTLNPDGRPVYTDTAYNALGKTIAVSNPYFPEDEILWTRTEYDELGRVDCVIAPDETVTKQTYNGLESTVIANYGATDGPTASRNQTTTTVRNQRGWVVEVTDNNNKTMTYSHDARGNVLTTTDCENNSIVFAYDLVGNKTYQNDPDSGVWHYGYDGLGQLIAQTNGNRDVTHLAYDRLGRLTTRTCWRMESGQLQEESSATWVYDGFGEGAKLGTLRREELRDGSGTIRNRKTYAYDELSRPMLELQNLDNKWYYSTFRYDEFSRVKFTDRFWRPKGMEGSGHRMAPEWNRFGLVNEYNQYGIITQVQDGFGHVWWETEEDDFDAHGRLLEYRYGNGAVSSMDYNRKSGFLEEQRCRNGGSALNDLQWSAYSFDRLGNLEWRKDKRQDLHEDFEYDHLNRLKASTVLGGTTLEMSYTDIGNINTMHGSDVYNYKERSASPHAVTSIGHLDYFYDNNGNIIRRDNNDTAEFAINWTAFGKPRTLFDGLSGSEFTYDANQSRVTQIIFDEVGEVEKKKIYIGSAAMEQEERLLNPEESDRSLWQWENTLTRIFISSPAGVIGIYEDTELDQSRKYLHKDHLGSIIAVSGEQETISGQAPLLATYSYDAWGKRRNASDWNPVHDDQQLYTDRGFTGHEMLDHLDLVHMNGRIYDQKIGRFISADPIIQAPANLQSYNRYSYVFNNPISNSDPSGFVAMGSSGGIGLNGGSGTSFGETIGSDTLAVWDSGLFSCFSDFWSGLDIQVSSSTYSSTKDYFSSTTRHRAISYHYSCSMSVQMGEFDYSYNYTYEYKAMASASDDLGSYGLTWLETSSSSDSLGNVSAKMARGTYFESSSLGDYSETTNFDNSANDVTLTVIGQSADEIGGDKFANAGFSAGFGDALGPDGLSGGLLGLGNELQRTGSMRLEYEKKALALGEEDIVGRDFLKDHYKKRQTALGKEYTKSFLKRRSESGYTSNFSNARKTNIGVNRTARAMKYGGRGLMVAGAAMDVYEISTAPKGQKLYTTAVVGGRWAGGLAGAWVGAQVGTVGGPWGVAIGAFAFGIIGAVGGEKAVRGILRQ